MQQTGRFLIAMLLGAALAVALNFTIFAPGANTEAGAIVPDMQTDTTPVQQSLSPSNNFTETFNRVSPSVVAISVATVSRGRVVASGTGSGFVVDTQGHIVTNNHVVDNATQIEVEFFDGTLVWADIVGTDPDSDLAVLRVNVSPDKLRPVTFGDSDQLEIGQGVLAIGSPFGQDWTLTSGIVSGLDRTIRGLGDFSIGGVIQTDAAINPGNSGGPLLDLDGRVIGVNSQIATTSNTNSGVGFAVPSNLTQRVIRELVATGQVDYSYLGITGVDVSLALLDELGLQGNVRGVAVARVFDGPAARAGLRGATNRGNVDIITAINGQSIKTMDDLISYLARETVPGDQIILQVVRDGTEWLDLNVSLTGRP